MFYYNSKQLSCSYEFGKELLEKICCQKAINQALVFLCIASVKPYTLYHGGSITYTKVFYHPQ